MGKVDHHVALTQYTAHICIPSAASINRHRRQHFLQWNNRDWHQHGIYEFQQKRIFWSGSTAFLCYCPSMWITCPCLKMLLISAEGTRCAQGTMLVQMFCGFVMVNLTLICWDWRERVFCLFNYVKFVILILFYLPTVFQLCRRDNHNIDGLRQQKRNNLVSLWVILIVWVWLNVYMTILRKRIINSSWT